MPHRPATIAAFLAATLAASCALPATAVSPAPSTPPSTSTLPTSAGTQPPTCPPAATSLEPPNTTTLPADPSALTDYLDRGGDLPALVDHLRAASLLPPYPDSLEAASGDVDGDSATDVALALQQPGIESGPRPPGSLFVWLCRPGGYLLAYQSPTDAARGAPVLLAARDLTGDGAIEIVAGRPTCGAHTCYLSLSTLSWNGVEIVNVFSGTSEDLPSPTVSVSAEAGGTGTIAVTAGGVASVGAGPPRPRTRTWTWDRPSQAFVAGPDVLSAPVFRVHVVHDADAAFRAGEDTTAKALYDRALSDNSLEEWEAAPATPASLKAYVRYRLVLLAMARGGRAAAQEAFNTMVEATVGVPEATPYLALAQLLLEAAEPVSLAAACGSIRAYAAENPAQVLDPLYYGYDNRVYSPDDLCPFD